jgi:hypothetical protein
VLDLGSVFDAAVFESGGNFVDLFQANILNELIAVSKNRRSENSQFKSIAFRELTFDSHMVRSSQSSETILIGLPHVL